MKTSGPMISALAVAFAAFAGVAYAEDPVKAGANYDKPGRQIDENSVTSRTRFRKPGREFNDDAKTRTNFDRPGSTVSDGKAKKLIRKRMVLDE